MKTGISITLRLTLLFAVASAAVLLSLGVLIGKAVEHHFEMQDRQVLDGKLQLLGHALSAITSRADLDALPAHLNDALVGHHELTVALQGADGRLLFATPNADSVLREAPPLPSSATTWTQAAQPQAGRDADTVYRGVRVDIPVAAHGTSPVTVTLAMEISHHAAFMASFRRTLWLVTLIATALSALLGWIAARYGLAPLRDLTRASRAVSIDRLDYRLSLDTVPAELRETAASFNDMLARLEDSFKRLTDFASDLAHELRTPISNLMTQTQVTLAQARTVDAYRETLYSNAEEFERLARMISDMLFLAKADHGLIVPQREPVDLAREMRELFEFYDAVAQEQGVRLMIEGSAGAHGDRLMLRRALSNLLSNAIRHTPRGGTVRVILENTGEGAASVAVENPGTDILPEHLPRIFDRFYRVDPSRQSSAEGAGLGLAITQSIIRAHGGNIGVRSSGGTTRFTVIFPAAPH